MNIFGEEIIGQTHAKAILSGAITSKRIAQSYLFYGDEGVGKESIARAFAKVLNCEEENKPCNSCDSCKKIDSFTHPSVQLIFPVPSNLQPSNMKEGDIREYESLYNEKKKDLSFKFRFDKATSIHLDQIQLIKDEMGKKGFQGKWRVVILLEADRMTQEAGNAFLKILEEPPQNSTFILLTSRPDALLTTICSRCQKIRFTSLTQEEIKKALLKHKDMDLEKANIISALADGSIGRAIHYESEEMEKERNVTSEIIKIIFNKRANPYFLAESLNKNKDRKLVERVIPHLILWYRDLLYAQESLTNRIVNKDRIREINKLAKSLSAEDIRSSLETISEIKDALRNNVYLLIVLVVLLLSLRQIVWKNN